MGPALPVYLEALSDLGPAMIEAGCIEITKRMRRFPAPGDIRESIPARQEYAGLPQLTYPEVSKTERDEAIELMRPFVEELRRRISVEAKKLSPWRFYGSTPSHRSIAEQKEILRKRGFLK